MRIAVVGAGGVGGYFGGRLAQAGKDVVFIARGAHLEAIRSHGLRVDSALGGFHVTDAEFTDDPGAVGPVGIVVMAVKAWQVPEAARAIAPMVGPDTVVVPTQNGIEGAQDLAAVLGDGPVLAGYAAILSSLLGPGHVRHDGMSEPFIAFKETDNSRSARVDLVAEELDCDGFAVNVPDDIDVALWTKLLNVSPVGALGGALRSPGRYWRDIPRTRRLYEDALSEVKAVAATRGVDVGEEPVKALLEGLDSVPVKSTTSMQRDILAGRPSELEAQVGAVVRLGEEAGVPTPVYSFIYASLLINEKHARGEIEFQE